MVRSRGAVSERRVAHGGRRRPRRERAHKRRSRRASQRRMRGPRPRRGPLADRSDARHRQLLALPLVLIRLRAVGDVGVGVRHRRLSGHARAAVDVPAGSRAGRVRVDRVLVAERGANGQLVRLCGLDAGLEATGPAGTGGETVVAVLAVALAATVLAAQVLVKPLVLVGLGPVRDVGRCVRGCRLRCAARPGVDVPARGRGRRVRVDGVLVALGDAERPLVRLGSLDTRLEAARPAGTGGEAVMAVLASRSPCRRCPASGPDPGRSWPCC